MNRRRFLRWLGAAPVAILAPGAAQAGLVKPDTISTADMINGMRQAMRNFSRRTALGGELDDELRSVRRRIREIRASAQRAP